MSGIKLTINLNESIKKKLCFKCECLNYFLLLVTDLCTNTYRKMLTNTVQYWLRI